MKVNKVQTIVGLAVLVLTFLITIQFKSVTANNAQNSNKNVRVDELLVDLKRERERNEDLEKQLSALQNDITKFREEAAQHNGYSEILLEQLNRAEILAGLVDVKGPGITITLTDNQNKSANGVTLTPSESLIHDEDIRGVINELCAAGAEAIDVNGSRIISTSAVRCVGPSILINDEKMTPPYKIHAVGKADQLEAAMNLNGGVIDNLKVWGFTINITKHQEMTIPKYNGIINFSSATSTNAEIEGGTKER